MDRPSLIVSCPGCKRIWDLEDYYDSKEGLLLKLREHFVQDSDKTMRHCSYECRCGENCFMQVATVSRVVEDA